MAFGWKRKPKEALPPENDPAALLIYENERAQRAQKSQRDYMVTYTTKELERTLIRDLSGSKLRQATCPDPPLFYGETGNDFKTDFAAEVEYAGVAIHLSGSIKAECYQHIGDSVDFTCYASIDGCEIAKVFYKTRDARVGEHRLSYSQGGRTLTRAEFIHELAHVIQAERDSMPLEPIDRGRNSLLAD